MFGILRRITGRSHIHVECRHCGTTISSRLTCCPLCQRTEFARYDLGRG